MKRKTKNIIMISTIGVVMVASAFTMKYASSRTGGNIQSPPSMENNSNSGENGTPPEMPNNQNSSMNSGNNIQTPPTKPDDSNGNSNNTQQPPTKPDDSNGNSNNMQQPPAKPDDSNENSNGKMEMPNMPTQVKNISTVYYVLFAVEGAIVSTLVVYLIISNFNKKTFKESLNTPVRICACSATVLVLTIGLTFGQGYIAKNVFGTQQESQMPNNMQMPGGNNGSSSNITYNASKEITESTTIANETYSSSTSDENAVLVDGDIDVTLSNITVNKTGDSEGGDNSNFYGNNSAIIAKDGAKLTIENATISTEADGANGVFSYGGSATTNNSTSDGTEITISNSTITTTGDNAGGIMTTGGGTTNATNLTINTSGTSSAAIRSDRGGGTVTVNEGTYTTTGNGSPAIYSTADITVNDATLIAKASEGIVIEGANTVTINNCDLTDSNTKLNGQSTTYKNIFLYQSMSGDAANGNAVLTATNSNITTNNGDTFYITNTTATINLTNNTIVNNDSNGNFLRAQKDSWGNTGSNGGNVTLVMKNQKATGNIVIDSISTLDMTMETGSYYEGTINGDNQAKSITLTLDSTSQIKLTGDSYVTSLEDADTTYSNIDFNGYILYVNGVAIN